MAQRREAFWHCRALSWPPQTGCRPACWWGTTVPGPRAPVPLSPPGSPFPVPPVRPRPSRPAADGPPAATVPPAGQSGAGADVRARRGDRRPASWLRLWPAPLLPLRLPCSCRLLLWWTCSPPPSSKCKPQVIAVVFFFKVLTQGRRGGWIPPRRTGRDFVLFVSQTKINTRGPKGGWPCPLLWSYKKSLPDGPLWLECPAVWNIIFSKEVHFSSFGDVPNKWDLTPRSHNSRGEGAEARSCLIFYHLLSLTLVNGWQSGINGECTHRFCP